MNDDKIKELREGYYKAIMLLNDETDILQALPQPTYEAFYPITYGLLELIEQEVIAFNEELESTNDDEYREYLESELSILTFKKNACLNLIKQADEKKTMEEQSTMFPKKKLIFATTKTGNIYLEKDLKSFPEEYLESVEECLSNLENGFIEENNQKGKKLGADAKLSGLHEIKTFKVRVFYKNLTPDTVYIMMARMKKSTNDLIDRSEPVERNKKTTGEFEELKEEIKDPIKKEQLIEQNNEIRKRIKEHIKENRRGKND